MDFGTKITDKIEIKRILVKYLKNYQTQTAPFLVSIFDKVNNVVYEGSRPIGVFDVNSFYLSNTDSNYCRSEGVVNLDDIGYVIELE